MVRNSVLLAAFATLPTFCMAANAAAHGEQPNAVSLHPIESAVLVRANFGLVSTADPAAFVCEEAFLGGDGWQLAKLGPTEWVTFGENSVQRTTDGCEFEEVQPLPGRASDVTVYEETGAITFLLNQGDEPGVYVSNDRGRSFRRFDLDASTLQLTGVRFSGPNTLVLSAYTFGTSGAAIMFELDLSAGSSRALALPEGVTYPYVLDARGGDILWLGRPVGEGYLVFWGTADEPARHELQLSSWPTGARLADDLSTAWVSGTSMGKGVHIGTRTPDSVSWTAVATDTTAACLALAQDVPHVCAIHTMDDFDVARIDADGVATGIMDFRDIRGPVDCPAESDVGTVCPLVWREIAPYFGVELPPDPDAGGMPDTGASTDMAGDDAGAADSGPGSGNDKAGCCASTPGRNGHEALLIGLLGLAIARSSRRFRGP